MKRVSCHYFSRFISFDTFSLCSLLPLCFFPPSAVNLSWVSEPAERPPVILSSWVSEPSSLLPLVGRVILSLSAMVLFFKVYNEKQQKNICQTILKFYQRHF